MENKQGKVVLEPSTNTHTAKGNIEVTGKAEFMNTVVMRTNGKVIVEHGEHHTVATSSKAKCIIKVTQMEKNPVTQQLQSAFD